MRATVYGPENLPRLRSHEAMRAGLRRVLLRCVTCAGAVADREGIASERVHAGRVAVKRARAVLRLAEAAGARWAPEARRRLAKQARTLAGLRDAEVMAETARRLGAVVLRQPDGFSWPKWKAALAAEVRRRAGDRWPVMRRLQWKVALAESVRRMHEAQWEARHSAKPERLHEWRKTVIVLREQLNVLRPRLTPPECRLAERLHLIARRLGSVQDLSLVIKAQKRRAKNGNDGRLLAKARRDRRRAIRLAKRLAAGLAEEMARIFAAKAE
jgi:CHAD domain-containing protein